MKRITISVETTQDTALTELAAALRFRQPSPGFAEMGNRGAFFRWLAEAYREAPALVLAALDTIPRKEAKERDNG